MKIGIRKFKPYSFRTDKRVMESLSYAFRKIQESPIAPYVSHVWMYGSRARGTGDYGSDIDLLIELSADIDMAQMRNEVIALHGRISPPDVDLPEVDMHTTVGAGWKSSRQLYYRNVRKDGIDIWETEITHI